MVFFFKGIDIKEIKRLSNKYPLLSEFMIRISQEYDKYYCLMVYILEYLFETKIGKKPILIDLYKKSYIMKI